MRKKKNRSQFLKAALLASCFTVMSTSPAYAYANENVIEENAAIEHPVVQEPIINRGDAFSVEGNAEVLDHITNDESKEFYTIRTENNQTFYMVIDHAQTSQNVYMLSTIDEADLQAFLPEEETEKPMISLPVLEEKEPEVTKAPLPVEEKEEKALPDTETMMLFGIGAVCVLLIALLLKGKGGKKQVDTSDENLEMEGSLHLMDEDGDEDYFDEDDFDDN